MNPKENILIEEMMSFYAVIKAGSFSKAALKQGVSKSHMSNQIARLEKALNIRLLHRSTRQLSPTEEGKIFYTYCQQIYQMAHISHDAMADLCKVPMGTLKISLPPAFGLHMLKKPLAEFAKTYPNVKLNVTLDSAVENLLEKGYDLVLRSAVMPDSGLMAQPIYSAEYRLCATPAYLKSHGPLDTLEQLSNHQIAAYSGGQTSGVLKFLGGYQEIEPYLNCNNLDFVMQMVMSDCCVAVLPHFMINEYISSGKLTVCLPEHTLESGSLYAVYPNPKFVPLRVKMFVLILKKYLN